MKLTTQDYQDIKEQILEVYKNKFGENNILNEVLIAAEDMFIDTIKLIEHKLNEK